MTDGMTEQFYLEHAEGVAKIARGQHRGADHCEVGDVEQAIWEHVLVEWPAYRNAVDQKTLDSYFRKAANRFMQAERRDYMYFSGSFMYRPVDVGQILAESTWVDAEDASDIEGRVDVQAAWRELRGKAPAQARAVFRRHALHAVLSETEQRNADRGVDAITHLLNEGLRLRHIDSTFVGAAA